MRERFAFVGGGHMADALIGGLLRQGLSSSLINVIDPSQEARERLTNHHGVATHAARGDFLLHSKVVLWAVKPQVFREAAQQTGPFSDAALHISIAAGIGSASIAQWLGSQQVVRTMPNTPALIGMGITGMFARAAVGEKDRALAEQIISATGEFLWVDKEEHLDAVTALSGSGPAYVFYFIEAMVTAGIEMGLSAQQAHQLAVATFVGASTLAKRASEPPETLRQRVTSKEGTTFAAINSLEHNHVKVLLVEAMRCAHHRASVLGAQFGTPEQPS